MKTQKYAVNQYLLESILAKVREGEIAIPEIQRPFVWDASQVRDLLDSLYQGFPVGYLIAWRNPDVKLKDGTLAAGKMILIDGQQRVTALTAAVVGQQVINKEYRKTRITIAFHPIEEKFEVWNQAIARDASWIPDVSPLLNGDLKLTRAIRKFLEANPEADEDKVEESLSSLSDITKKQIGLIELSHDLDIETVTEIFIRINSKGTVLSQADFAMSKIAADQHYGGPELRKAIDYFCHMAVAPEFYGQIKEVDTEFAASDWFQKMAWLKNENDDLYDPSYTDLLRVAFATEFGRGKLSDLVSLLSGRNFATKQYEDIIAEDSFRRLGDGVRRYMNETHFKRFVMIIKSAGFISAVMVRSQNALNFGYTLYLRLRAQGVEEMLIEHYVRRWFVLSILTGRFSGAAETQFERDTRLIEEPDFGSALARIEQAELSPAFWEFGLVQSLEVAATSHPLFWVFIAAQIKAGDTGFLSRDVTVRDMVVHLGDIHHIFPREHLKRAGLQRAQYNQIGNYAYTQDSINIKIGSQAPNAYFAAVRTQCDGGPVKYGAIDDHSVLSANLAAHCVPEAVFEMDAGRYEEFLTQRRQLMAAKIRAYYAAL
jgi:hypothetical protein